MSRLRALFSRYCDRHFMLRARGCALPGPKGHLDCIRYNGRGAVLDGWSMADSIRVSSAGHEAATAPKILRTDVAVKTGLRADVGFCLELPEVNDGITLSVTTGDHTETMTLADPDGSAIRQARARLKLQFARDMIRAAKHLGPALLRNDLTARARVKTCLGLDQIGTSATNLENRLFDCAGLRQGPDNTPITIILPVYGAFELLQETLARVVENTDLPWHLIVIDDATPDPRMRPFLRDWCEWQGDCVTHLENTENLGFIGTVNRGFAIARERGDHVVLLNSDALVPQGWASRLIRPFGQHDNVASVTPFSNDATILTAPVICEAAALANGDADKLDAVARHFNPEALVTVIPTGVGYCMALNTDFLRQVPQFDTSFGRGYCEEVDWCQKTRKLGGRHLGLPGLFVEHRGSESFGAEDRAKLLDQNMQLINARYPEFDAEVHHFMDRDPMATARLALGMALVAQDCDGPTPVYIAHSMGGGAENYVAERIRDDLLRGIPSVVLRVGGRRRWRMELHREEGITAGNTDDFDFILSLLEPIHARRVIYSCGVGDSDPVGLPDLIQRLVRDGTRDRLDVLVHDFFPLSPSYTLLDQDMTYRGPVEISRTDRAHATVRPDGRLVSLADWRTAWGRLFLAADRVLVFSDDSRRLVEAAYPWAKDHIDVTPHRLPHPIPKLTAPTGGPEVIGVLGSIGAQKGAAVLRDLAKQIKTRDDLKLVVIGVIDPAFELGRDVAVTGAYKPDDIAALAHKHGVTRWLIPSIWPETFSYTTHEALATGLPVHAFDLGAQAEAVRGAINGVVMPFDPDADLADIVLTSIQPDRTQDAA